MDAQALPIKPFLTKIGITLSFIAGFLLAPELLGLERLRRIERKLELFLGRIKSEILPILEKTAKGDFDSLTNNVYFSMASLFMTVGVLLEVERAVEGTSLRNFLNSEPGSRVIFILNLLFYILLIWNTLKSIWLTIKKPQKNSENYFNIFESIAVIILGLIFFNVYFYLVAAFFVVSRLIWLFLLVSIKGLVFITNQSVKLLEGDSAFRQLLIPLGIAFYILGNLLQFLGA